MIYASGIMGMIESGGQLAPLYRRLPHGPSGMERDEVARNQRDPPLRRR